MKIILMSALFIMLSCNVNAADDQSIANKIQVLKQQAVLLHKDLAQLEQDLLYPSTTQIAIYVSKEMGKGYTLGSLSVLVDDVLTTQNIYTQDQNYALSLGGMQRLYMGNLSVGDHRFTTIVKVIDANDNIVTLKGEAHFYKSGQSLSLSINLLDGVEAKPPILSMIRL
jgi:hypothetical protein